MLPSTSPTPSALKSLFAKQVNQWATIFTGTQISLLQTCEAGWWQCAYVQHTSLIVFCYCLKKMKFSQFYRTRLKRHPCYCTIICKINSAASFIEEVKQGESAQGCETDQLWNTVSFFIFSLSVTSLKTMSVLRLSVCNGLHPHALPLLLFKYISAILVLKWRQYFSFVPLQSKRSLTQNSL